jgi:KaiC/GvpD/RAD55 family RecA-like ATPase
MEPVDDIIEATGELPGEDNLEWEAPKPPSLKIVDAPEAPPLNWYQPDTADLLIGNSELPWVSFHLSGFEISRLRVGTAAVITAPTGAGKSSLAIQLAAEHARRVGPVVYLSLELDADVVSARIVGQECAASWEGVLRLSEVSREDVHRVLGELHRMYTLSEGDATLEKTERALGILRDRCPGEPPLVVIDYLQLLESSEREERTRVSRIAEQVRQFTVRHKVVTLAVAQTSRGNAKSLRDGELFGADTTSTAAESSQIEKMATRTFSIGGVRERDDGCFDIDLNTGKSRFGGGDQVWPAIYNGRTGRWSVMGAASSATQVREERREKKTDARGLGTARAIQAELEQSPEPRSRAALALALGFRKADVLTAVRSLVQDPSSGVVEVRGSRTGGAWPLWTKKNADTNGLDIVPLGASEFTD